MRWAFAALLSFPLAARAASIPFADDFETGTLLSTEAPPGMWDSETVSTNNSVAASNAGAHRGNYGFRALDSSAASGAGDQAEIVAYLDAGVDTVYARMWIRLTASNDLGDFNLAAVVAANLGGNATSAVGITYPDSGIFLESDSNLPNSLVDRTYAPFTWDVGAWHLVEVATLGVGTDAGTAILWVDGARLMSHTHDWSQVSLYSVGIGEQYAGDNRWAGTLDFDDVRFAETPHASQFGLAANATQPVGSCSPFDVGLFTSDQVPSVAPYAVTVNVSLAHLDGGFFQDSACTMPVTALVIPEGAADVTGFFVPYSEGVGEILASHVDFLGGNTSFASEPAGDGGTGVDGGGVAGGDGGGGSDGGAPGPSLSLGIGCGCGAPGSPLSSVALCLALLLSGRKKAA